MSNEKFRVKFGLQVGDSAANIDGTTGDITTSGDLILNGNSIKSNGGNTAIELNGFDISTGDIKLNGGDIRSSDNSVAISVSGANATIAGDLTVTGNDIKSSSATALTLSGADVAVIGDLTVTGNDIKSSSATALTLSGADVTVAGDLTVTGNDIKSSSATALTLSGADVTVAGDLILGDNTLKGGDGVSVMLTDTGSAEFLSNVTIDGNTTLGNTSGKTVTFNGQVNNNITFTNNNTTTNRGVTGTVGSDDYWKYGGGSTATDAGYAEIATGDNGTEPIYARQYTSGSVTRTLTLLDATGNTQLAGDLIVNGSGYIYSSGGLALDLTGNDVRVVGDLTIDGGDLVINSSTANVANTTATTVNMAGAATTVSIGAGTGTTTVNNSLVADDLSTTTVDTTNLEVSNIKAKDGTAAITIADTTGTVTVSTDLTVDNINISGNTIISTDTNGNITLDPNGTGDVALTFANGGNLTNNRNFVHGAIRNSTTESIGDIWAVNSTGPANPYRGVSLDNSSDTAKGPGTVLRSYSGGAVAGSATRGRIVFEKARGTAASPTAIQGGDFLGSIDATGYTSTGWINDNILSTVPAFFGFVATENWVSNTNLGNAFSLAQAPTSTTITSSANLITTMNISPESSAIKGDRFTISQGKTAAFTATGCSTSGSTLTIGTLTSGTISVGNVLVSSISPLNNVYIVANISGSGSGSTWTLSGNPGTLSGQAISGNVGIIGSNPSTSATTDVLQDLRLIKNTIKSSNGTTQITTSASGTTLALAGDQINLQTAAAASITGNNINYNRVFGQWQYDATITPAGANTAYAFPWQGTNAVTDYSNIATATNTSRIQPNALGYYNVQFSIQLQNTDNGADHTAYIWWKKNGVDIPASMGRVEVTKQHQTIAGWNSTVQATATTDYFELMYAVSNVALIFPFFAATAFGPSTAAAILTIQPVGA